MIFLADSPTAFSRWRGMLAALLGIMLYAFIAGVSAGVLRAAIMGGQAVFAVQIGRRSHGVNSPLFVVALMAPDDPHALWDVNFQLSSMATLWLLLYADPLLAGGGYTPLNPPEWIEKWKPQAVLLSVAAGDRLGRPDPELLAALDGFAILRTELNGWIELSTDGEQMWVELGSRVAKGCKGRNKRWIGRGLGAGINSCGIKYLPGRFTAFFAYRSGDVIWSK